MGSAPADGVLLYYLSASASMLPPVQLPLASLSSLLLCLSAPALPCSEDQIKNYLEKTLGEAPRPPWGVSQHTHRRRLRRCMPASFPSLVSTVRVLLTDCGCLTCSALPGMPPWLTPRCFLPALPCSPLPFSLPPAGPQRLVLLRV
jgi:hypothetical protein